MEKMKLNTEERNRKRALLTELAGKIVNGLLTPGHGHKVYTAGMEEKAVEMAAKMLELIEKEL